MKATVLEHTLTDFPAIGKKTLLMVTDNGRMTDFELNLDALLTYIYKMSN